MKTQQETLEVELMIHINPYGAYKAFLSDMSEYGYVLLGSQVVTVGIPDKDPVEAEVEMLNKKEASLIKEHLAQLHAIQQRKNDLLCIENKE